jgi:2-polyprenyl-6-hydroxyphenyl methylase/3-demethylubiquinone-9 3-methyltransferase
MTATDNVYLHEINKFGSMAERWWDTQGEFKTLHDINPLRIQFIQSYANIAGKRIVDVGCESGVDAHYQKISAETLAQQQPESFDHVTCMEMLEHVPDPGSIISACATLVKPGGMVFFSTLNRKPKAYLLAIVAAEHVLQMLPKGTHVYKTFIKPSELCQSARAAGLELQGMVGIEYNPFSKHFSLGKDIDVNYIAAFKRPE